MSTNLRDEIASLKVKQIIKAEKEFEFPVFIRTLRKALGVPRKMMAKELGISEMMIYYKEEGKFTRMPETEFLVSIAEYLRVPKSLLIVKARAYVDSKQ